ncbi:MAG: bifunctional folylpolyglutamate synthase/dihydrofolate synthase [Clostridiales bacterium]|nr:bifunctional folylpolyglutamate synthase/dihydrofolate synthase [Clostridiales bacterium]
MPDNGIPSVLTGALQFGIKPGLERITKLLDLLGNPQDQVKSVHVAGTNGKGSVCTYLSTILACDGRKVGVFTSPYLERFSERIRIIDGKKGAVMFSGDDSCGEIPSYRLDALSDRVAKAQETMLSEGFEHPTEFELITAIAFLYYAEEKVDICVLETGLGGRLDSTNIIKDPVATGICALGLDHCGVLGSTISEIASEKAGIFKPGAPAVCIDPDEMILPEEMKASVRETMTRAAEEKGSPLTFVSSHGAGEKASFGMDGKMTFTLDGTTYSTCLNGRHQVSNAALAIALARLCKASEDSISEGISLTRWKCRCEILSLDPLVIIDGGHNPQGAESLAITFNDILDGSLKGKPLRIVAGMMADKDVRGVYEAYRNGGLNIAEAVTVRPANSRSMDPANLSEIINDVYNNKVQTREAGTPEEGVRMAFEFSKADGMPLLVTGSLYLAGQVRGYLKGIIRCTTI